MHYNMTKKITMWIIQSCDNWLWITCFLQRVLKAGLSTNNHTFLIVLVTDWRRFELLFNPHLYLFCLINTFVYKNSHSLGIGEIDT
jgi:hypothetical protein